MTNEQKKNDRFFMRGTTGDVKFQEARRQMVEYCREQRLRKKKGSENGN